MAQKREQRFYAYTFELYEESVNPNFEYELKNLHCKVAYALHDKDKYSEEDFYKYKTNNNNNNPEWAVGDTKKAHYHIILKFENLKSIGGVLSMLEPLGVKYIMPVQNERGLVRYLIHFDDKDKYQYSRDIIKTLCGYEINKFFGGDEDMANMKNELRDILINSNEDYVYNFFDFYKFIFNNYPSEYLDIIDKYAYTFQGLINAKTKKREAKQEEEKRLENIELREKELDELEKESKKIIALKKLEVNQKKFDKKEHFKETYLKLLEKENLDANELKLKDTIENFFSEYEQELEFMELIESKKNNNKGDKKK